MSTWLIALVTLGACGFSPRVAGAPGTIDGAIDGTMAGSDAHPTCGIAATRAGVPTTSLGGVGGSARPDLTCATAGELPIGISLDSTQNARPEGGGGPSGERVVSSIRVTCGKITQHGDGTLALAPAETVSWMANTCATWGPFVSTPEVLCPANSVLVGLDGNGGVSSLFNTVTMLCASLNANGTVGALVGSQAIADTGNYANHPQSADCPQGTAIVSFQMLGNCSLDELTPTCAPLACN